MLSEKQNVDFEIKSTQNEITPKLVVAIDGPAASGKGTLGRKIAERYNLEYLDTGSLYRAVALAMVMANGDPECDLDVRAALNMIGRNITPELLCSCELRSPKVSQMSSKVAALPIVREYLLDHQRNFSKNPPPHKNGVVLDGRDIGTVVCPEADIKLFVTATPEVRAERRYAELKEKNTDMLLTTVLQDIKTRDERDSQREVAPLVIAKDAFVIDTSKLNVTETLDHALDVMRSQMVEASSE